MIKKLLLLIMITVIAGTLFAQNPGGNRRQNQPAAAAQPVPFREISGVVRDTTDNTLIGATIVLRSRLDTLRTTSNNDGIFVFKNVKMATFTLTITEVGFVTSVRKYLQNDAVKRLVLEPIVLKAESRMMNEVKINGTPSITYKVDTVEYKASDYKVRENATIDELLKKMEGFEVGTDGSVTHQGQTITKAKLNGKTYAGGDVAQAIQNLPADIVEKIQVVDDYGDVAARTGVKEGDPQKVLNITTKADRSVGTTGRASGQYGNDDRYAANLSVLRINANQQLGVIGALRNTVNGVASTGVAGGATNGGGGGSGVGAGAGRGGSPGTTQSGGPAFNYRDQWSKKIQVVAGYAYNFANNNSLNNSYGARLSNLGPTSFVNSNTSDNNSKNHRVNFDMEYTIDSANFMQITPNFSYSNSVSSTTSDQDNIRKYSTGLQHDRSVGFSSNTNSAPQNYGMVVFYQHLFKKPHRNASIQLTVNRTNSEANNDRNNTVHYYQDTTQLFLIGDSISHYRTLRTSANTTYRGSATYVEPLSLTTQLEFNAQVRKSVYDNASIIDTVLANDQSYQLVNRSNISNYSFTESRATVNYRFNGVKYNISVGTTLIPSTLSGTKFNTTTVDNVETTRSFFKVIPVARFAYSWSRTERFTIAYSGSNTEPTFTEIQPFVDISDKQNHIIGNPDLNPSFTHSISAQYNNYIANSKLNFSLNGNATFTNQQIIQNNVNVPLPTTIINGKSVNTSRRDIYYLNIDGSHAYVGRYNIAKQLDDRRYNLSLNGNVTYNYGVGISSYIPTVNGQIISNMYHTTNWRFDERFGPRISPTESIEINPYIGYDLSRSFNSLPNDPNNTIKTSTQVQTISLAVDGRMYFFKTYQLNYSASKSYVTGLTGLSTNPLVINAGFEKEFFKRKNLVLTFNVFDLLHQNNFVQQTVTSQGYTNTLSNSLSRYFLFGLRVNLQKWSGSPTRNGKKMNRRGDGSFIYN